MHCYTYSARGGGNLKVSEFRCSERFCTKKNGLLSSLDGLLKLKICNNRRGFTLAEVLITLGIIGVVAALTIPHLVAGYQKKVVVDRLKKSYSIVGNLLQAAQAKHGAISEWPEWSTDKKWYQKDTKAVVNNYLLPEIKAVRFETPSPEGFFYKFMCYTEGVSPLQNATRGNLVPAQYLHPSGLGFSLYANQNPVSIQLADGTCVAFNGGSDDVIATVYIDINGSSVKPNIAGKDLFMFQINSDSSFRPQGLNASEADFLTKCSKAHNGVTDYCAAKILRDGWQIKSDYPW